MATAEMPRMTLYEVALEGMQLEEILAANDGELTPELEERFDRLLREGPNRIEAAAVIARSLESDAEICANEARRLMERAASLENQAKRLKERMMIALDAAFGGKVKTAKFTIWNQTSAATTGFDLAPEFTLEMVKEDLPAAVRTELSLDKKKLLEMHKGGDVLPESIIVTENPGMRSCRIK